jgi:hypothetical protein
MSNESVEIQMARQEERMKTILFRMEEDRLEHRQSRERIDSISHSLNAIGSRVENVESSLARATPTIDEFITIKHKVVGAGLMGKWAWTIGAGIIGFLFGLRAEIGAFFK